MQIQQAKQEHDSLTILSAQWLKRFGIGFTVGNAILLGVSVSFPTWYEKTISRPVMGLNLMFAALGVKEASGIRQGRLNAGGVQKRGAPPVFLDRIIPQDKNELRFITETVEEVRSIGANPGQIKDAFHKVGRIEADLNQQVAEKTSAIAELARVQRELSEARQQVENLKGVGTPPPKPLEDEEDSLFAFAVSRGKEAIS